MLPGSGGRNPQELDADIAHQFTAFDAWERNFDSLFVPYFVIFPLRRNAPASKSIHFGMAIKEDRSDAIFASAGTKDFVGDTNLHFDLIDGDNGNICFLIQHDRIRFLVMGRQRRGDEGMHPRGRVGCHRVWHHREEQCKRARSAARLKLIAGARSARQQHDLLFISGPHGLKEISQCPVVLGLKHHNVHV